MIRFVDKGNMIYIHIFSGNHLIYAINSPRKYSICVKSNSKCLIFPRLIDMVTDCLFFNGLLGFSSKKHQISVLLTVCEGNPSVTSGFPTQTISNAEDISCHDVTKLHCYGNHYTIVPMQMTSPGEYMLTIVRIYKKTMTTCACFCDVLTWVFHRMIFQLTE